MQKHTQIYLKSIGYTDTCFIPSEISGKKCNDIHHIISRGKCGEDRIENLMALTREEHEMYGDKKKHMNYLLFKHYKFLKSKGVTIDEDWFNQMFTKYSLL